MSFRDDVLPIFDGTRGLLADMQVGPNRLTDVVLRVTTWTGERVGIGTSTVTDTPLTLDADGRRVKVSKISSREVMASGGRFEDGDYRVGPFTPAYDGGGRTPDYFTPPVDGVAREVHVVLNGPGLTNVVCRIIDTDTDKTFRYIVNVRRVNQGKG